jgi:hypothetical protein
VVGVSGEMAQRILELHPTPASLVAAYAERPTLREKQTMLAKLKTSAAAGRALGDTVSARVHAMVCGSPCALDLPP